MTRKRQLNVRLSETAHDILRALCDRHGVSQAAFLDFLLRDIARRLDVPTETRPHL